MKGYPSVESYMSAGAVTLACSGPSLRDRDPFLPGLPVMAVSTAIRAFNASKPPHLWCLCDTPNRQHHAAGSWAFQDPRVIKIFPSYFPDRYRKAVSYAICVPYCRGTAQDRQERARGREEFDGRYPLLKGVHKSVTFAIQYCHIMGVKTLVFAGNDLSLGSRWQERYCYERDGKVDRQIHARAMPRALSQVAGELKKWHPIIKAKGFRWLTWSPGVTRAYMEIYDPDDPAHRHLARGGWRMPEIRPGQDEPRRDRAAAAGVDPLV